MARIQDPGAEPVTLETVREVALSFPGVEEGTSYGTPSFRVRGTFLTRLHDSGEALVMKMDFAEREMLMETDPVTFYITDHYRNYPYVLVRLSTVSSAELRDLFEQAWRAAAPKRLVAAYDSR